MPLRPSSSPGTRRRVGAPAALLVLLAACGGGGGDGSVAPAPTPTPPPPAPTPTPPAPTTVALRVPVDTVRPGTLARVVLPGGGAPERVDGTIAGVAAAFARQDDSTLVALVPEAPTGVQPVRLALAGRTGEASLSVLAGVAIANPTAIINAEIDAALAAYASTTPPAGIASADWLRARSAVDSIARDLRTRLATASAADQLAAARLLTAARAAAPRAVADGTVAPLALTFASPLTAPSQVAGAVMPIVATAACASAVASATVSVGALYAGLGATLGAVFVPGVNVLLAPVGGLIVYRAAPLARADVAALAEACYVPEGIAVQSLGATVFESGRAVAADVVLRARALSGAEARDGVVARVTDAVENVLAAARALPSSLSTLASYLPARLSSLPTQPATARPLAAGDVRVESVTPSTVTVGASGSGTAVLLTATTVATTETPFTATLAYAGDPTLRTTVSGTVRPAGAVSVSVSPATATITGLQQTLRLTATVTGASNTAVRWTSSDLQVADVSADGTVLSRAPGTVTIRATSDADPTRSAQAVITVTSGIAITLTPPSATVPIGGTVRLTATLSGTNSTGVVWSSANGAIASVTAAGDVTGLAPGTTQIRATAAYDLSVSATATITVTPGTVTVTVSPTSASLQVGQTQRFTATVTGTTATGVAWFTSNSAVAAVDNLGNVTAVAAGTATITARSLFDLTRLATATVTVGASAPSGVTRLTSGVAQSSLSGAEDSQRTFVITVPTGATRLEVRTSGGSGDVDLYVRRGQPPAGSTWDCSSTDEATTESCVIANPVAGEWYVTLLGYQAYAGVALTATVTGGSGGTTPPPSSGDGTVLLDQQNLQGAQGSELVFTVPVPTGYSRLEITLENSLGDLYVRRGARAVIDPLRPTLQYTADCASFESNYTTERCTFQAPSGTYYVTVYGYHAYSGSRVRAVAYR